MKQIVRITAIILLSALGAGCAAPGSGRVQVSIKGQLLDATHKPLSGQQVDLMLPKEYGLAGLDAVWGKPEDYGHLDQKTTVTTDSDGVFTHTFAPVSYSMLFWFIPPLGPIPKAPPDPYVFLHFPPNANEYWSVWARKSGLETRVAALQDGKWLQQSPTQPAVITGSLRREMDEGGLPKYFMDITVQFLR